MLVYIIIDIAIILGGLLFFNKNNTTCIDDRKVKHLLTVKYSDIYYFFISFILFIVSAFRGNFTSDHQNYIDLYTRFSHLSIEGILKKGIFSYPENGYLFFQYIIKSIFDNYIYIFIVISLIIVVINVKEIKSNFANGLLPLILFVEIGNYYLSFNIMRTVFAASIILMGSKYLYNRENFKYFCIVLLAASIHKTSLIMIPCYYLLNIKFARKGLVIMTFLTFGLTLFLPNILAVVQKYYWEWYTVDTYGMSGYSINSIIFQLGICFLGLFLHFVINKQSVCNNIKDDKIIGTIEKKNNIWLNSVYFYIISLVLGMSFMMIERFSTFFSMYSILFVSSVIYKSSRNRKLMLISIIFLIVIYGFVTKYRSGYNPYFFV